MSSACFYHVVMSSFIHDASFDENFIAVSLYRAGKPDDFATN